MPSAIGRSNPAFLLYIGGSQVDGDVRGGNVVSAILEGGAHSIAAFAHRCVGQPHSVEMILVSPDAGAVDLHLNNIGIDAVDGGA
jgi:hypothetical protein